MRGPRFVTVFWLVLSAALAALSLQLVSRPVEAGFDRPLVRLKADPTSDQLCILVADPTNKFTRVPPPLEFALRTAEGMAPEKLATITVNYTGFTTEAQAAFQYAVNIWQGQLTSTAPIVVDATFTTLGPGVLGSAGAASIFRDFTGATFTGTWYAKALANKLFGADVDPSYTPEINASFNSSFNWYYGTDGLTPAGQYDFVTVVLHELCHGLGFFGSASVSGGLGTITRSGYPDVYDRFVENGSGQVLWTAFASGTAALATELQSNSLYWNGASGVSGSGGTKPRLYAPSTWAQGSSYSHLNESTYPAGNGNSLMTYALGAAEAIHDPGPISRGMLTDEGWTTSASCSYSVSPTTVSVAASGGSGNVGVTTSAGCSWTATSNAAWLTITAGANGSGSGTVSYTAAANTGVPRSGTLTVAGQTVTFSQASPLSTLSASPATLRFGAVNNGGTLTAQTPAQEVTLTKSGSGTVTWTATANQPWIQISSGTGTGSGKFTVGVANPGNVLPSTGNLSGTVTVSASGAQANPTVAVQIAVYAPGSTASPFGVVETPVNGATGVTGSLPVTGWALDDVGVARVRIYRDGSGGSLEFVGDATLVAGARPDVATAYPAYPYKERAGWGYMLLTNMLPNQGNGTYTLRAYAEDLDGHSAFLGARTITCTNATATLPFGTIDTPAQGATISGSAYVNFGWALTPQPKTIPSSGSTITVFVDGLPLGTVTYNNFRSDVATLFPGYANANGAVGYRILDTTTLANGVHTIAWSVTDDAGAAAGIGSRFFTVLNGASGLTGSGSAPTGGAAAPPVGLQPSPLVANPLPVYVRRGYDLDAALRTSRPDADGLRRVRIEELDRLEVHFGAAGGDGASYSGFLRVGRRWHPLPVGSQVRETGVFFWQPGAGFVGSYDLVFVRTARDGLQTMIPVQVSILPLFADQQTQRLMIDAPQPGLVSGTFLIGGWALDLAASAGTGIDTVHVWAYPHPGSGTPPIFLGTALYGGARPDVGAVFGSSFTESGYGLIANLPPGPYDLAVFPRSTASGRFGPARTVRIVVQ